MFSYIYFFSFHFAFSLVQISGTAAKLGQPNAYHHCTLLVNSNKDNLADALVKDEVRLLLFFPLLFPEKRILFAIN